MKIAVYCSACDELDAKYVQLAQRLGTWIGSNGHTLVHGGVNAGLMHVTAQAVRDSGGEVIGIVPQLFAHRADPLNNQLLMAIDLNDRKGQMVRLADAFVVLPGGIGTLDEWISTLSQLIVNQDDKRGIIVADIDGLYDGMAQQLHSLQQSPFARGKSLNRSVMVHDGDELITELENLSPTMR